MGLFGGSTTYVASTLYNLAGEVQERPNYLKTTVVSAMVLPSRQTLAENVGNAYLTGPGMKLRTFFRWAENHYGGIGVPRGNLGGSGQLDAALVAEHIPKADPTSTIECQLADLGVADYTQWVEQWLLANNPGAIGMDYTSDISADGVITIIYPIPEGSPEGTEAETDTFTPDGFDLNKAYIYAAYTVSTPAPVTDPPADPPEDPTITGPFLYIYELGSGNPILDALGTETIDHGEYIPFIPIRLDNKFLSETFKPDSYALAKKAMKKVGAGSFDKMVEKLADNESLPDIDFAYLMFGVPLNILHVNGREYLYRFFERLRTQATNGNIEWLLYQVNADDAEASGGYIAPPTNVVHIKSNGVLDTNVNMKITWNSINRETGTGPGRLGAKEGDYWTEKVASVPRSGGNAFKIWHQIDANNWESLLVIGAIHHNLIYNNKSVITTGVIAFDDPEESGFLVPIHYATLREMTLKNSTELGTQCSFLVLNSYKVVKKKWYQTGIFKIFTFVLVIGITVLTAGAGTAPAAGLLGSAAAVGATIGLTGTMALIAGAIANALVAMIVMKIVSEVSTIIFGEKWGAIIGALGSIVTMQIGTSLANGVSLSAAWGNMLSAQNLIALTSSVGSGIAGFIQAGAMQTIEKTEEMMAGYAKESAELAEKFAREFGYGKALLDPLSLTDASIGNATETSPQFLSRTLMTGTDIAEMSKDMLNNFAEYTLSLKQG